MDDLDDEIHPVYVKPPPVRPATASDMLLACHGCAHARRQHDPMTGCRRTGCLCSEVVSE